MKKKYAVLSFFVLLMIALLPVTAQAGWTRTENGYMRYTTSSGYYTGWHTIGGYKYYFSGSGIMATKWKNIGGKSYYFGTDGKMRTGWQDIGQYRYYLGTDGVRRQGWTVIKNSQGKAYTFYFTTDTGRLQTGFQTIDNKRYFFTAKGVLLRGFLKFNAFTCYADPKTGELYQNKWLWVKNSTIESQKRGYYFMANYKMAKSRWINGRWVGADGLYTGTMELRGLITDDNGRTYFYDDNHNKVSGFVTVSGKKYYFMPGTYELAKGWFKVGNYMYAANSKGVLFSNAWIGKRYVNAAGAMVTGWYTIGTNRYYFRANGYRAAGWEVINNTFYFLNSSGVLQTNAWVKIGEKCFRTGADGAMLKGLQRIGTDYYYFSVKDGNRLHGWITNGTKYYYAPGTTFIVCRNKWFKIGGYTYYAKGDCSLAEGLTVVGTNKYFFNTKRQMVHDTLQTVGNYTFYMGSNGAAVVNKWQLVGTKYYYFGSNGAMLRTGQADGYFINADGSRGPAVSSVVGWKVIDGKKYYYEAGKPVVGWKTISNAKYYFDKDGVMVSGINSIDGKKYYFYPTGKLAVGTTVIVGTSTGAKEYTCSSTGVVTAEKAIVVSGDNLGAQIAREGLKYIGNPYVWGGESLTNGADCSGFTLAIFKKFGITLGHYTDWQLNGNYSSKKPSRIVDASALLPGDLIFYGDKTSGTSSHVGIYIGNEQIVHASNSQPYPAGGIKISDYRYNTNIVGMVRYWS